jgi:signal transduction histidine kinase
LHSRIAVALLVVGALLVGVVAASAVLLVQIRSSQDHVVGDYYYALRTSQDYYIRLIDSETAVRGYALSSDPSMLDSLKSADEPWARPISPAIGKALPEETQLLAVLAKVETAVDEWYRQWAEPTMRRTAGSTAPTTSVAQGGALFDRVQVDYAQYIAMLRGARDTAASHLMLLSNLLFEAVLASALIAVLGGLVLWFLMRQWVSRPVAQLAAEARTVSDGDLGHGVAVSGPPEFVRLGEDVEAMRERLVAQIGAFEAAGREVASAQATLEEQTLELQRSNRELEQFAYVASHDLQEPLRKVASFCQLLERRYAGQLDERADQYIHFAVDGAKRMQQLINDLLEFSRVGRLSTPSVDVELMDCLHNALANLEAAREESGAEVTWDELPRVRAEAPLLTQLLQNLIGNAIKFRSEAPPRIHLGVRREGDYWQFSCSDNGIGIEPEYAERVFLIFQRLHPKEEYSGTGIGLAMCKKIVEHLGGRIWLEPTTPGANLCWTLPAELATDLEPAVEPETLADQRANPRALVEPAAGALDESVGATTPAGGAAIHPVGESGWDRDLV